MHFILKINQKQNIKISQNKNHLEQAVYRNIECLEVPQ